MKEKDSTWKLYNLEEVVPVVPNDIPSEYIFESKEELILQRYGFINQTPVSAVEAFEMFHG